MQNVEPSTTPALTEEAPVEKGGRTTVGPGQLANYVKPTGPLFIHEMPVRQQAATLMMAQMVIGPRLAPESRVIKPNAAARRAARWAKKAVHAPA